MADFDLSIARQLDAICSAYSENWSDKRTADISRFLNRVDEMHRDRLLKMLIAIDLKLRHQGGQVICTDDYACIAPVTKDVIEHLIVDDAETTFAPRDSNERQNEKTSTTSTQSPDPSTSRQIGPYKLLQTIGEGGMGSVWMAEQEKPVRRRVAIKLIKAGMDTRQVIARFEAERQALSMMDHPNIAKVLDAGTTEEGQPYFAMELVQGIPFTQYCDRNKLTPNERLQLFSSVCHAIQHAHQKGIIHRDIKPSNVLVTLYDGKPVPKVIDFGLAKALQHENKLTDKTMFTGFGQLVGTLQYMSPEQAEMNALDVDTRTDIYSLGVMLYELLTGSTPLDKKSMVQMAHHMILEQIREKDPPRPSARLSESGEAIKGISEQRKIAPSKLQQILRGELDWIVMKALEKDRTRRYGTASDLAQDIQRFLNSEAVVARPPSAVYRLKKFVKKNRAMVGSSLSILLLLVLGIGGTSWFAWSERIQREIADKKTKEAGTALLAAENAETTAVEQKNRAQWLLYLNQLASAQREWELNNVSAAWDYLNACQLELRGWEHRYLVSRFSRNRVVLGGHDRVVNCVAVSPDSRLIASGSGDGMIFFWNLQSGEKLRVLQAPSAIHCLAFSSDGSQIVAGGGQSESYIAPGDGPDVWSERQTGFVTSWDVHDGKGLLAIDIPNAVVHSVVWSDDGSRIIGAAGNTVRVWNAANAEESLLIEGHQQPVNCVAISRDGKKIASCSGYADDYMNTANSIKVWDAVSGDELWHFTGHSHSVKCIAFDPRGEKIVSGSLDCLVKVWDLNRGMELLTLRGHTEPVLDVDFDTSGTQIVSGSADHSIRVWDITTQGNMQILRGHTGTVRSVCFSLENAKIVSSSSDKTVVLWDWQLGDQPLTIKADSPKQPLFSRSGRLVGSVLGYGRYSSDSAGAKLQFWNAETGAKEINVNGKIDCFAFSRDESCIVRAAGSTVTTLNVITGKELGVVELRRDLQDVVDPRLGSDHFESLSFSPDAQRLVTFSFPWQWVKGEELPLPGLGKLQIWDVSTGEELSSLAMESGQFDKTVAFSLDSRWMASSGRKGQIIIWNVENGAVKKTIEAHADEINCFSFNADGTCIVSASDDKTIKAWRVDDGNCFLEIAVRDAAPLSVSINQAGTRIVAGCGDNNVYVWDAFTADQTMTLSGHEQPVMSVAFSPGDSRIVSATDDEIKIWD